MTTCVKHSVSFQNHVIILTTTILLLLPLLQFKGVEAAVDLEYPCNKLNGADGYPFCNTSLSVEKRAANLVALLTTEEKIGLLVNKAAAVPRLGIPTYEWWNEALHGVATSPGVSFTASAGPIASATSFPQPILTASSFNSTLFNKIGQVISTEARALHNAGQAGLTYWTPNINLFRDPRWGRGQETPGEDPLLTSIYAEYFVRGLQEEVDYDGDASKPAPAHLKVSACCKHFAAYDMDAWEGVERYGFDARVTQQDLEDSFNPPFQACIQSGRASGLMCSYNALNGIPTCADPNLLTTMARGTWEFDGYIVSDCDAVQSMYAYHNYSDPKGAVAAVLKAGMDINCGDTLANYTGEALENHLITEDEINMAMTRSFIVQFRLGLFDGNPLDQTYGNLGQADVCSDEHQQLALEAAQQGIVLLKNDHDILPLSRTKIHSLAIIGPNANDSLSTMLGNYHGDPCKYVTPRQGLGEYVDKTDYVAGCSTTACEIADVDGATAAAIQADATILVVGLALEQERESFDRTNLLLPGQQQELVLAVAAASKGPLVLVVMSGGCIDISFAQDNPKIGAILWVGYPGQAGGDALAQIVFGDINPGGKLPSTWYREELTSWAMTTMDMRPNKTSGYPGRSYRFYTGEPIYKFGDGLSYSKIAHSFIRNEMNTATTMFVAPNANQLRCGLASPPENCTTADLQFCSSIVLTLDVLIKNSGGRAGTDVVLLYVSPPNAGEGGRPLKQLVEFQRVAINGDEEKTIQFIIEPCRQLLTTMPSGEAGLLAGVHTLSVNGEAELTIGFSNPM